jgi:hypothetical protein
MIQRLGRPARRAAVVGVNTSAQLEAGILGRPVFTIRSAEFSHAQEGTLHFRHIVNNGDGLVRAADSVDEHVAQLAAALRGDVDVAETDRRFVRSFIRPLGLDRPVAPIFAHAIETLAAQPRPSAHAEPLWVRAARLPARPLAAVARQLADDRPLWVFVLAPLVGIVVWASAAVVFAWETLHRGTRIGAKRARRQGHRLRYETAARVRTGVRRARKSLLGKVRGAGVAARRVMRRQL